jgi:hypothetical protein
MILQYIIISLLILLSLLFSIFNGVVINWKQALPTSDKTTQEDYNKAKRLSIIWHGVGLVIHMVLITLFHLIGGYIWLIIGFFLNWLGHNIIIALIMGQKWYYVGTTAWTDKLIRRIPPFINFD